MDTREIVDILKHMTCTKGKALNERNYGVYPCDHLPNNIRKPAFVVANTDPARRPGTHWISFYIPKRGPIEYFDSFGGQPRNKYFREFMKNHSKQYVWNTKRLQSNTTSVCGHYCCMYLYHRCSGRSMETFLEKFNNKNYIANDLTVLNLYSKISPNVKKSDYMDVQTGGLNICNQSCKPKRKKR